MAGGEVNGGAGGEAQGRAEEVEGGGGAERRDEVVEEVLKRRMHPEPRPPSAEPKAPAKKGRVVDREERGSEIESG